MKGWMRPMTAANYADVSLRTMRNWLAAGLRHSRVNGVVLISKEHLDEWLETASCDPGGLGRMVDEVMRGLSR